MVTNKTVTSSAYNYPKTYWLELNPGAATWLRNTNMVPVSRINKAIKELVEDVYQQHVVPIRQAYRWSNTSDTLEISDTTYFHLNKKGMKILADFVYKYMINAP